MLTYIYMPNNSRNGYVAGDSTYNNNRYIEPEDTTNEVNDFISFAGDTSRPVNIKHYTEKGLIKLQSAISYVADKVASNNNIINNSIDSLDKAVAKIDTSSAQYVRELKPAFFSAVRAMDSIQKLKYTGLTHNIENLKNTENSINAASPIKQQFNKIKQFFRIAGVTLQQMKLSYAYSEQTKKY